MLVSDFIRTCAKAYIRIAIIMLYWYRAAQDVGGGIIITNNQVIVLLCRAEQDVGGDRKQVIVQLAYNWLEM